MRLDRHLAFILIAALPLAATEQPRCRGGDEAMNDRRYRNLREVEVDKYRAGDYIVTEIPEARLACVKPADVSAQSRRGNIGCWKIR